MKSLFMIFSLCLTVSSLASSEKSRLCEVEKVYIEEFDDALGVPGDVDPDYTNIKLSFNSRMIKSLIIGGLNFEPEKGDKLAFSRYSEAVKTVSLITRSGKHYNYTIDNTRGCGYLRRGSKPGGDIIAITNCVPFLGSRRCTRQPDITNPRIGITN